MLNILVVDDEKIAREQIAYTLEHNYEEEVFIKTVSNGYRALEIIKSDCPDILLTDIRMPKMDGITLAEKAREIAPEIKIIFTTAYTDKDILKSAIKISVVSFVEKPIITGELVNAVKKAAEIIERSRKTDSFNMPHLVLAMAKKDFDKKQLLSVVGHSGYVKFENMSFKSVVIKCIPHLTQSGINQSQVLTTMSSLLIGKRFKCMYAFKSDDVLLAHFYFSPTINGENKIDSFLLEFMNAITECNFFCCTGSTVSSIDELYISCEEAIISLERSFFRDSYGIVYPAQIKKDCPNTSVNASQLYELLEAGDKTGAFTLINDLFVSFLNSDNILVSTARNCYIDIVNQMFTFSHNYHLKFHELYSRNVALSNVLEIPWLKSLNDYVCDLLSHLFDNADFTEKDYLLVQKIISCIEENYTDSSFSVSYIADYCKFTPSYVSMVFKNKTGSTINSYVNDIRLRQAKAKLISTNETLEEIALSTGYSSSNYFCNIFKKSLGVTPTEYRNKFKK